MHKSFGQQGSSRVRDILAIKEKNGPVYIGGAATFSWRRCAASGRWYFSAEGHQQIKRSGAPGTKSRAEKLKSAGQ